MPGPEEAYIATRDILLRLEGKFDAHFVNYAKDQVTIHQELGQRPRRTEVVSWLSVAGVLSGIGFGAMNVFFG